jgi:hypothetical protein
MARRIFFCRLTDDGRAMSTMKDASVYGRGKEQQARAAPQ